MFRRSLPRSDAELEALARRLQALPRAPVGFDVAPRARARVLAQVASPKSAARVPRLAVAAGMAALLALSGAAAALAAPSALPGDPLYGLKRFEEQVQLLLTLSPADAQAVRNHHEEIRAQEAEAVKARQRDAGTPRATPGPETGTPKGGEHSRSSSHEH